MKALKVDLNAQPFKKEVERLSKEFKEGATGLDITDDENGEYALIVRLPTGEYISIRQDPDVPWAVTLQSSAPLIFSPAGDKLMGLVLVTDRVNDAVMDSLREAHEAKDDDDETGRGDDIEEVDDIDIEILPVVEEEPMDLGGGVESVEDLDELENGY